MTTSHQNQRRAPTNERLGSSERFDSVIEASEIPRGILIMDVETKSSMSGRSTSQRPRADADIHKTPVPPESNKAPTGSRIRANSIPMKLSFHSTNKVVSSYDSAALRRGKWTREEEEYTAAIVDDFAKGYIYPLNVIFHPASLIVRR
jgi:hypothetical protein